VAFVFPSGGSSGAAQVGILAGLLEAGIAPGLLVGSSVGALNAAYMAVDPTLGRAASLETVWRRLGRADVFGSNGCRPIARLVAGRSHVFAPTALRSLIATLCPITDLRDATVPIEVVTTDLDHGVARWWSAGPAPEVLYASACLPGVFPPAILAGHRHVDGGVLEPSPAQRALELDAAIVYVLGDLPAVDASVNQRLSALDVLVRSFTISRYARLPEPSSLARHGQRVVVVPGADTSRIPLHDFRHTARLIEESKQISRAFLRSHLRTVATSRPLSA
jgi:NTE family protein